MPTSINGIRGEIMAWFELTMKTILVTGGYNFDLGQNVYPWRECAMDGSNLNLFNASELPAIVFRDLSEDAVPTAEVGYGKQEWKLNVEVLILCEEGSITAGQMRLMIADVLTAIGTNQNWHGFAIWTEPVLNQIKVVEEKNVIGGARLMFQILYRTARYDPYST